MNREIKFRGRSVHTDDWCYGSFVNDPDEPYICGFDIWNNGTDEWREEKVEPETVGQFVGLHDKNGKEIYEGDIIRSYGSKGNAIIHVVSYDEEHAGYIAHLPNRTKYDFGWGHIEQSWVDEFKKEVVGNVHDTPELLKGGEK